MFSNKAKGYRKWLNQVEEEAIIRILEGEHPFLTVIFLKKVHNLQERTAKKMVDFLVKKILINYPTLDEANTAYLGFSAIQDPDLARSEQKLLILKAKLSTKFAPKDKDKQETPPKENTQVFSFAFTPPSEEEQGE